MLAGLEVVVGGRCAGRFTAVFFNSAPLCRLVLQVFVNFARQQHDEVESHAYEHRVDTADELPLRSLHQEEKV